MKAPKIKRKSPILDIEDEDNFSCIGFADPENIPLFLQQDVLCKFLALNDPLRCDAFLLHALYLKMETLGENRTLDNINKEIPMSALKLKKLNKILSDLRLI